jgi:anti-sigma regulatory factor (Ser/Thr protein kinase)
MPDANPTLSLAADLASLKSDIEFARHGAVTAGLPEDCWGHLDLVVEEIFVNVVCLRLQRGKRGRGRANLLRSQARIAKRRDSRPRIRIQSAGVGGPNLSGSLNERSAGGVGVFLVRRLTESLDYRRDGEWNRLRFGISALSSASVGQ